MSTEQVYETYDTKVMEFLPEWLDSFGMISGAYEWAEQNMKPGDRVIGARPLQYMGLLNLYKFDIRRHSVRGITAEFETPARCDTVIRVNGREMVVVERGSKEIIERYQLFHAENGELVWRPWYRRAPEFVLEADLPAATLASFLQQCNRAVQELSKRIGRSWIADIRLNLQMPNPISPTPTELLPLLGELKIMADEAERGKIRETYVKIMEHSIQTLRAAGVAKPLSGRSS